MTIQIYALLVAAILPYVWHFASLPLKNKQLGGLDLNEPRARHGELLGSAARAVAAQANAWVALGLFAAANLAALMAGADPQGNWALASMIWVAARVLHGVAYIADIALLRVACFFAGLAMSIWILLLALG